MALTWPRLHTILNSSLLFFSLVLVAISPAILYLTIHGMRSMDEAWPQSYYIWYRGPSNDMETEHKVALMYEFSNEPMIIAAAAASALAGTFGTVGFFLAGKVIKPSAQKPTIFLQIVPGIISFIVTFIAFVYTQVVFDTDNMGKCDWTQGYKPNAQLKCTREQAICKIVGYFTKDGWDLSRKYHTMRTICHDTQTGRHLVAPLFVASLLLCGFAVSKFLVEKREIRYFESADERVERLERQVE
ncbi:hypothetical protein SVAN01_10498 [Stagonosporopsis vannaccii]|nr:hypothetical protein SVAN01_10498 [Stagonosporopsis vannaccii]